MVSPSDELIAHGDGECTAAVEAVTRDGNLRGEDRLLLDHIEQRDPAVVTDVLASVPTRDRVVADELSTRVVDDRLLRETSYECRVVPSSHIRSVSEGRRTQQRDCDAPPSGSTRGR